MAAPPKVDPKTVPPSQFALSKDVSEHAQLQSHAVSKIGVPDNIPRVDPRNVPPSQFVLSADSSRIHQQLQSKILDPNAIPPNAARVDPKNIPPSQYVLSADSSRIHQQLQSHVVLPGQPAPGVPVVDPKGIPPSQYVLSADSSRVHQRLQSHVGLPSAVIKAGVSKFGDWKKRPVYDGTSVMFDESSKALMECLCDPCACSPPPEKECRCNPCECSPPGGVICDCDPCECSTPEGESGEMTPAPEPEPNYNLTNFMRAREFFMNKSTKTGISLYDHFSELIRQLLDNKAPDNPVDFVEEISLNLKRYRFGAPKDTMRDAYYLSDRVVQDAEGTIGTWKQHALWSAESAAKEDADDPAGSFGGFPNLLRLQYYLEQVNIGLPREEIFKVALTLRQIRMNNPVTRVRFWGKIFGLYGSYYIFEAEVPEGQALDSMWTPPEDDLPIKSSKDYLDIESASAEIPGPVDTLERAGKSVTDPEVFNAYGSSVPKPPEAPPPEPPKSCFAKQQQPEEFLGEGALPPEMTEDPDAEKWHTYQDELMQGIPEIKFEETVEIPAEDSGKGVNRRVFFVLPQRSLRPDKMKTISDPMLDWTQDILPSNPPDVSDEIPLVLPPVTPQQINISRQIRWHLTGDLNEKILSCPPFPGREADYLHALLARITAGTSISPRGYYRTKKYGDEEAGESEEEEEEEDVEEEEEAERNKTDIVYPNKKFRYPNVLGLVGKEVELWVHHASYILKQGRVEWIDPTKAKAKKGADDEEEVEEEEEEEEIEEEEDDDRQKGKSLKEIPPNLFTPLSEDKSIDPVQPTPWSTRASSSVFTEFHVAHVRSNLWPGANAICTYKGKVENIYFGDGLKFSGRTYAPWVPCEAETEYKDGPELTEIPDPSVAEEQEWLAKLQLDEMGDIEDKFVDNEDEGEAEEEEEDEDDDED